jgi:hypothetical protein
MYMLTAAIAAVAPVPHKTESSGGAGDSSDSGGDTTSAVLSSVVSGAKMDSSQLTSVARVGVVRGVGVIAEVGVACAGDSMVLKTKVILVAVTGSVGEAALVAVSTGVAVRAKIAVGVCTTGVWVFASVEVGPGGRISNRTRIDAD